MPRYAYSTRAAKARSRSGGWMIDVVLALVIAGSLAYGALETGIVRLPGLDAAQESGETVTRRFVPCTSGVRDCVVDGDTIRLDGTTIRIADIDTPEVRDYQCAEELALGQAATRRMTELVNGGGFTLRPWTDGRDEDVYGRKLRVLVRDGTSLGMTLVAEGLAQPWTGRKAHWC